METSHVFLAIAIMAFTFGMTCLLVLYMMKRAAVNALNMVVDKTIDKASDLVSHKVIDPTMAVATDGMKKGIDAVGSAVKQEYQESKRRSPANIDVEMTQLAQRLKGRLTTAEATSQLKLSSKEVKDSLKRLKAAGECSESPQGHYVIYVFSAFLEKVKVWSCAYCAAKYHEDPHRHDCPSCGGQLEIRQEALTDP
jgi:rubrerythrin